MKEIQDAVAETGMQGPWMGKEESLGIKRHQWH
jgi:hypothetical protein